MNFRMAASLFSALTGPECAKERGGMGGTTMCAGSLLSVMTPERLPAALIASVWLPSQISIHCLRRKLTTKNIILAVIAGDTT